jgi:hypothetical protein
MHLLRGRYNDNIIGTYVDNLYHISNAVLTTPLYEELNHALSASVRLNDYIALVYNVS